VFDRVRALLCCEIVKHIQAREPTVLIACALKSDFARNQAPREAGDALDFHD